MAPQHQNDSNKTDTNLWLSKTLSTKRSNTTSSTTQNFSACTQRPVRPDPVLPVEDRGLKADPTFKNLLKDATVTHLAPKIGTELSGIQLHELTNAQRETGLLIAHRGVVFFRDQEINIEQQWNLDVLRPLHVHQNLGHPKDHHEALVVENSRRVQRASTSVVHKLQGADNPPVAYDRLTPPMREFISGLTAIHTGIPQAAAAAARGQTIRRPPVEFEHPVVRTHPVTGRRALYVNPAFTKRIVQLSTTESAGRRTRWAIWDNRSTFHYATFDYLPGNRHAVRVTPHGEVPYFDPEAVAK
ncbi:TauD/TfdA-like domain [Phytophthora cactorum]|nr:TauD/TfdA-like domain [Phytophthora cactorum]